MRTFLRGLAAVQVVTTFILAVCMTTAAGVAVVLPTSDSWFSAVVLLTAAAVLAFLAVVGGILWCVTDLTLPPKPPVPPGRPRPLRWFLRVLAQVQLGVGALVIVFSAVYAGDRLLVRPRLPVGDAIEAVLVLHAAIGLSCLGGLLWCAVRVAYPDEVGTASSVERPGGGEFPAAEKSA